MSRDNYKGLWLNYSAKMVYNTKALLVTTFFITFGMSENGGKDCVLNDVVAHKRWAGGGMTLRGVSYIIYDDNKPLSSCERRGTNRPDQFCWKASFPTLHGACFRDTYFRT